jgi:hypothetical protein
MPRNLIRVNLELDRIHVHDEGDGWGDAEPYLWTVFFKVDGNTVQVTDALKLAGPPTIHTTPGSHGNLGTDDADEGDNITIPSAIGEWETILKPIPGPASLANLVEDFGGMIGVVAVLMEEDNVSDDGANAGHTALNNAVKNAIQQIIDTRSISNQNVSDEEIEGFTSQIESKVKDAIVDQQNFFENLWSWLNPDDTIGTKVWTFSHDDLDPSTNVNFSKRWKSEGDWEIFGHITSTVLCPAISLDNFFKNLSFGGGGADARSAEMGGMAGAPRGEYAAASEFDLDTLRKFRDTDYQKMPGLARWFSLAERHTPRLIYSMCGDAKLRESVRSLFAWAPRIVTNPNEPLPEEQMEHAKRVLTKLASMNSRSARIDASRAMDALSLIRGKTATDAMQLLNTLQPSRHPNAGGDPSLRVRTKPETPPQDDSTDETMYDPCDQNCKED